ncbi:MAG: hypothetical protein M3P38_07345 [Chloroflexota bacterium]|nr:hypothetical protein [Chloroflexota bacterium]
MNLGPLLITVIALAVALAIFAGGWAARLLMHAAEPRERSSEEGGDEP